MKHYNVSLFNTGKRCYVIIRKPEGETIREITLEQFNKYVWLMKELQTMLEPTEEKEHPGSQFDGKVEDVI